MAHRIRLWLVDCNEESWLGSYCHCIFNVDVNVRVKTEWSSARAIDMLGTLLLGTNQTLLRQDPSITGSHTKRQGTHSTTCIELNIFRLRAEGTASKSDIPTKAMWRVVLKRLEIWGQAGDGNLPKPDLHTTTSSWTFSAVFKKMACILKHVLHTTSMSKCIHCGVKNK